MKRHDQAIKTAYAAFKTGEFAKAEQLCRAILGKQPKNADILNVLAISLRALKRAAEAVEYLERAIAIQPAAEFHANLGVCFLDMGKVGDAARVLDKAVELNDRSCLNWVNLAIARHATGDLAAAEAAIARGIALDPKLAEAHVIQAQIAQGRGDVARAKACAERALDINPRLFAALELVGVLTHETDPGASEAALRRALEVVPDSAGARFNLGMTLEKQARSDEALVEFERALAIKPDFALAQVMLARQRRRVCDWRHFDADTDRLRQLVRAGQVVNPFIFLTVPSTAEEQLACARTWVREKLPLRPRRIPAPVAQRRDRIRVGYLSADLHEHATAYLMAELWERHDRARFEVVAYSYGKDDGSAMRGRLVRAFDRFVDLREASFEAAARRIREDGIDILIDLKGYTGGARTDILTYRPAPLQINFIGYPGTMGADFIDYIIADGFIIPPEHDRHYAEKVIRLPHSYQPNDTKREIGRRADSRTDHGLAEDAFVFCSFNGSYKIAPELFDIWMRLLAAVPDSVLWLLEWSPHAKAALMREAEARGVDPARIVFALPLRLDEHLARHRFADLFLDTLPVNAHTTTSDALWAGLPVLTCAGETFVGRVAGSLLHAVGLPELVTHSLADYEAMALRLATDRPLLASLRARLAGNRLSAPLFDIERFTRDLERGLEHAWELCLDGRPPTSFEVAPFDVAPAVPTQPPVAVGGRMLYTCCPLCDHAESAVVQQADCSKHPFWSPMVAAVMTWRRCARCGHVFVEGYLSPPAEQAVLAPTEETRMVGFDLDRQRGLAAATVARVARHVPRGRWLDAGVGAAALLFTAEEWGYQVSGLDRAPDNLATLRQLGYRVEPGGVEDLGGSGVCDVLSLMDGLERAPFPRATMAAAARLVAPGGVLVLSVANADAMLWRILGVTTGNPYWGEPARCHNFGRQRLVGLLREHGFEPLECAVSERCRVGIEIIARRA